MTINTAPVFDTARQGSGRAIIDVSGSYDFNLSLTLQADGKILAVGSSENLGGSTSDFSVIRLNADGTLDASFSSDGKAIFDVVGGSLDYGKSVAVQADGKILVAGASRIPGGGDSYDFSVIRLNADGTLDTSFSGDGKATFDIGGDYDLYQGLTVQSDGKILMAGYSSVGNDSNDAADFSVIRLNTDGTLDTSFSGDGKALIDVSGFSDYVSSMAVQSDGKILIVGTSLIPDSAGYTRSDDFSVIRLNTDGTLDTSFSTDGKAIFDVVGGSFDYGKNVTVQADGKILVAGTSLISGGDYDFSVIRLNADGTLDTSFSGDGKATFNTNGDSDDTPTSLVLQPDGKILIGGYHSHYGTDEGFSVIRLNTDGTLDKTFNGDGKALIDVSGDGRSYSLTLQSDGKMVIAGTSYTDSSADFEVIRLNADGTLDNTFGSQSSSLGGTVGYVTGAPAIALDTSVAVYDAELAALNGGLGNYAGASVTLSRHGGASSEDVFSGLGNLSLSGDSALLSGSYVGAVSNVGGKLVITFTSKATQACVNEVLSSIGYANSSSTPSTSVQIDWLFSDGASTGALTVAGSTTVNIGVTCMGTDNADTLVGGAGDDKLIGLGGNDWLRGLEGNDILNGGAGADSMEGGNGSNTYYVDNLGDLVYESNSLPNTGGIDRVNSYLAAYTLGRYVENGRILAAGTASLTGNELNNVLYAGAGDNVLDGGAGTDTVSYYYASAGVRVSLATTAAQITGGSGSDTLKNVENLMGSNYADTLMGSTASNILSGGAGNDIMNGGAGNDIMNGGAGNDIITGGVGSDVLIGGLGADKLAGGTGADRFDFNSLSELGLTSTTRDTINDFKSSEADKIDLAGVDANTALAGDQAFSFIGTVSAFSGDATGRLRFDAVNHILYGSTDADTAAEFAIALTGVSSLSAADFVL